MRYVAKIEGGVVAQVTVEPDDAGMAADQVAIGPENTVGIGWRLADGVFAPPEVPPEV